MPKTLTLEETYDRCTAAGDILLQDNIDINKINSMIEIAKDDLESAKALEKQKDQKFGSIYKLHYDVIHTLTEALLSFDKVKSHNHQGLFAFLCVKHPELDLDWNFFEKIRTKRNGIHYYGNPIIEKDWKEIRLQMDIYIRTMQKALEQKISNNR
jgi:hypothetical protein